MNTRSFYRKMIPVIMVAGIMAASLTYLIYRLASERAYREKWKDYNDCGLA